ncbi:hypothetical protein ACH5RR_033191, partial [Cinchona calisaya]
SLKSAFTICGVKKPHLHHHHGISALRWLDKCFCIKGSIPTANVFTQFTLCLEIFGEFDLYRD